MVICIEKIALFTLMILLNIFDNSKKKLAITFPELESNQKGIFCFGPRLPKIHNSYLPTNNHRNRLKILSVSHPLI